MNLKFVKHYYSLVLTLNTNILKTSSKGPQNFSTRPFARVSDKGILSSIPASNASSGDSVMHNAMLRAHLRPLWNDALTSLFSSVQADGMFHG